jgi:mannose-6-phosphate isomerase-like protein (cupin superfamily)
VTITRVEKEAPRADVTVKTIDDFEDYGGQFFYAGKGLGVTAWGMNVERLPAGWQDFPDHDHSEQGQEEVYVVLAGDGTLYADGETWSLAPATFARVGAEQKRRIVPGSQGITLLALGGTPGKAYEPRK